MNCMNECEKNRELDPIEENELNSSSNGFKITNFFHKDLKHEESIILKTKDLNSSNANSIDPAFLFGQNDQHVETIIQPSNTFNFNIKEKEENAFNNKFKTRLSSIIDNCTGKTKTYFMKPKSISKSNNFEFSKVLKSRNNSISKNTFYKYNKTTSKYEFNLRTKQDEDKDFFMDLYKGFVKKNKIFDDKIQKVVSLNKFNNLSTSNSSIFYAQNTIFSKKIDSLKRRNLNKKEFIVASTLKRDSFSDFTINKNRDSRNNFAKENSIPKNCFNSSTRSRILKDNRFKNILRSTFSL